MSEHSRNHSIQNGNRKRESGRQPPLTNLPIRNPQSEATSLGPLIPKEHGAWALLYGPFVMTVAAFGGFQIKILFFLVALTALFLAHEPLAKLVRSWGRQINGQRLQLWKKWLLIYGVLTLVSGALVVSLFRLWLLIPMAALIALLLALHLFLTSQRQERRVAAEILGVFGLTASAPTAYYVIMGRLDPVALLVWGLNILYFTSGIFYVKMLVSRFMRKPEAGERTLHCVFYHLFAAVVIGFLAWQALVSSLVILAFAPIVLRAFWGLFSSPERLNFKRIGYTEVAYTLVFVSFMVAALR